MLVSPVVAMLGPNVVMEGGVAKESRLWQSNDGLSTPLNCSTPVHELGDSREPFGTQINLPATYQSTPSGINNSLIPLLNSLISVTAI